MKARGNAKGITRAVVGIVGALFVLNAHAQTNTSTGSISGNNTLNGNRFKMTTVMEANSTLAERSSHLAKVNGSLLLHPSYQLTKNYNLSAAAYITQEAQGATETALTNTVVRLSHRSFKVLKSNLSPSIALTLPTSEEDRDKNTFQTAISARGVFSMKLIKGIDLSYLFDIKKNFHEYTQNQEAKFNTEYGLRHFVSVSKDFTNTITGAVNFAYVTSLDYNGNLKSAFTSGQEIGFNVNKKTFLAFGHRNEGAATKADGVSSNIKIFDENSSVVYSYVKITN
ncbi:MAG: hypothetical protein KDD50_11770 [Bdellovibrionales bacterium]|nr:hypothetical protein [Bdellovibrionales bacterium]